MYYFVMKESPLGPLTMESDGEHLTGLWIEGQKYFGGREKEEQWRQTRQEKELPVFEQTRDWLLRYFAGKRPLPSELPLAPEGSEFRQSIWKLLCEIPYGKTTTYGTLAKTAAEQMGKERMSAQAVGGAVGHNPISIIIPCHRVIGADGSLTGYAGGIHIKQWLLEYERAENF